MRLATFNVNGIRAADRRGFRAWLDRADPDVVALQEVRASADAVPPEAIEGWHFAYDPGQLAGRNGVALLSKEPPTEVRPGLRGDTEFGHEGRYIEADYDIDGRRFTMASLYLPKGAVGADGEAEKAKYERKLRFCEVLSGHLGFALDRAARTGTPYTITGDFNIARTPQDLYNNHSKKPLDGFQPEERDWLTGALELGLTDVVRALRPDGQGPYSWWSWRGQSWTRDYGWRIDYHLSTPDLAALAQTGDTDRPETYESRVSDHAPVVVEYR
ncbi:MAG: exodeoxyribonuclease III [Propionibacteriaceae bacterium]|jgi:exodeoxyribonuclease-3|nr:exodeoxyribonuclease III [Propionibacteriaceae bacterium]